MSFSQLNLHPNISKAISACGYTTPTPIQAKSIPGILEGKDIVASAQTGTGKTAAFVLPALHRLSNEGQSKKTRILILTPTRELANQITTASAQYGKFLRFNIVNLVGGMPYHQQLRELARGADIIVATPGRLMDLVDSKRVDLSGVEMLVLDEADRMLDMGFIEDVEYIAKLTPSSRQTLLFSATVDKKLTTLVKHLLKNPVRIDLSTEKLTVPQIQQELYRTTSPHHKARLLKHFLSEKNIYKAIIFSATKMNADKIALQLRNDGLLASALHGDLRQNVRNRTIEQFRRGKVQFLIATDVAARGIDIQDVTHVFNYDLPKFCEDYVHRIGRTGRAGKSGVAISFVLPTDTRHVQRIERYIGQRLQFMSNIDLPHSSESSRDRGAASDENPIIKIRERRREFPASRGEDRENPRAKKYFSGKKDFSGKRDFSDRKEYSDRKDYSGKKDFSDRKESYGKKDFSERREYSGKKDFSDRKEYSGKKEFSDRRESSGKKDYSERREFPGKKDYSDRREPSGKKDYSDRREFSGKKDYSERRDSSDKRDFADKREYSGKKSYADRKEFSDRKDFSHRKESSGKKDFSDRREFSGKKEYSERRDSSDKRDFSEKRSFAGKKSFADRKDYSEKKEYVRKKEKFGKDDRYASRPACNDNDKGVKRFSKEKKPWDKKRSVNDQQS